jgi:SpoIID/LytB domain protein
MLGGSTTTSSAGRRLAAVLIAVTATVGAVLVAPGAGAGEAQAPADAVLQLEGRGFGHGVGLSQWGARYMADDGDDAATILDRFYPGTALSGGAGGDVRVRVLDAGGGQASLGFPQGGEIRSSLGGPQAPGFPVVVAPGGSVQLRHDGRYYVEAVVGGSSTAAAAAVPWQPVAAPAGVQQLPCIPLLGPCPPPEEPGGCLLGCPPPSPPILPPLLPAPAPPETAPPPGPAPTDPGAPAPGPAPAPDPGPPPPATPTGPASDTPLWAVPAGGGVTAVPARERSYRGVVQAIAGGNGLGLVNQVDLERYLAGMAEVPTSWPAAVQQAQAIAARTYALRAMASGGELCDTQRCQVYAGAGREHPNQTAAVDATRGEVLTFGGDLIAAVYSADAGGVSATTFEGFGTPDGVYPYLTTVAYDTPDPLPWSADIALTDVAARTGYGGTLSGVRVGATGPSGRALEVVLDGDAGPLTVEGRSFASALGLRSTLFTATVETGIPPPALEATATGVAQALPGEPIPPAAAGEAAEVGLPVERAAARPPIITPPVFAVVSEIGAPGRAAFARLAATVLAVSFALGISTLAGPAGMATRVAAAGVAGVVPRGWPQRLRMRRQGGWWRRRHRAAPA